MQFNGSVCPFCSTTQNNMYTYAFHPIVQIFAADLLKNWNQPGPLKPVLHQNVVKLRWSAAENVGR